MTTVISGFTRAVRGLMTSNIIIFVLSQNLLGVVCPVCLIPCQMFNVLIHLLKFHLVHLWSKDYPYLKMPLL